MVTRWDKWFSDDNLAKDKRILAAPPSKGAEKAAQAFLAREKQIILDLGCGIGRDTFYLESRGVGPIIVYGMDCSKRERRSRGGLERLNYKASLAW
jgi:SAM-dependent methyltransferase